MRETNAVASRQRAGAVSVNAENAPALEAVSPSGVRQRLSATDAATAEGPAWQAGFTPAAAGRWEVRATDTAGRQARVVFPVGERTASAELLNLPADVAGMRQLAESTGGALVRDGGGFSNAARNGRQTGRPKCRSRCGIPALMLALMLGLYATELIARRWCKLL